MRCQNEREHKIQGWQRPAMVICKREAKIGKKFCRECEREFTSLIRESLPKILEMAK